MTKKILAIFIAVMVCLSMAVSASAYTQQYVYDPDYHLTDDELYEISSYAQRIENESGYAVIFCIISDNFGETNADYAEEAYYAYTDAENALYTVFDKLGNDISVCEWIYKAVNGDVQTIGLELLE